MALVLRGAPLRLCVDDHCPRDGECKLFRHCSSTGHGHNQGHDVPCIHFGCTQGAAAKTHKTCITCNADNTRKNPRFNGATAAAKRATALTASLAFPSLRSVTRLSDAQLGYLAAAFLRRVDVAPLFARGAKDLTYVFFWTCCMREGWAASLKDIAAAERKESTSWLRTHKKPLLLVHDRVRGKRNIVESDIHYPGSPAYILRIAFGPILGDAARVEKEATIATQRTLGYAGNKKCGGTSAKLKKGAIHGASVLVIPKYRALGLVLMESARKQYEAEHERYDGCKGIKLPDAPPASFVPPPRDASGGFVLGGEPFLTARGMGSAGGGAGDAGAAADVEDDASSAALSVHAVEWDGSLDGAIVMSTGATLSDEEIKAIKECGGSYVTKASALPEMTLLIACTDGWKENAKGRYALEHGLPVITREELTEALTAEKGSSSEKEEEASGAGGASGGGAGASGGGAAPSGGGGVLYGGSTRQPSRGGSGGLPQLHTGGGTLMGTGNDTPAQGGWGYDAAPILNAAAIRLSQEEEDETLGQQLQLHQQQQRYQQQQQQRAWGGGGGASGSGAGASGGGAAPSGGGGDASMQQKRAGSKRQAAPAAAVAEPKRAKGKWRCSCGNQNPAAADECEDCFKPQ